MASAAPSGTCSPRAGGRASVSATPWTQAIEQAIAAAEERTSGEIRFVIETGLDPAAALRGFPPRERALQVFAQFRVWDTELRNGVLIYVLVADRDVEIVADRGAAAAIPRRVGSGGRLMEEPVPRRLFRGRRNRGRRSGGRIVRETIPGPRREPGRTPESADAPVAELRHPE